MNLLSRMDYRVLVRERVREAGRAGLALLDATVVRGVAGPPRWRPWARAARARPVS